MGCLKLSYYEEGEGLEKSSFFWRVHRGKSATDEKKRYDYYPFGLPMDSRQITREDYRYDYQGQYAEKDEETGYNSFQLRQYDARFGRWMSTDPYGQYHSPYVGMGNVPNMSIDPDGGFAFPKLGIGNFFKRLAGISFTGANANLGRLAGSGLGLGNALRGFGNGLLAVGRFGLDNAGAFASAYSGYQNAKSFQKVNLKAKNSGEHLAHNLREVYSRYKKQGYSGTIYGKDVVDESTFPETDKIFDFGKISVTEKRNVAGSNIFVNYSQKSGNSFGRAVNRYEQGIDGLTGDYNGGNQGANFRVSWGSVNFDYRISYDEIQRTKGKALLQGRSFSKNLMKYIMGRTHNLKFSMKSPY